MKLREEKPRVYRNSVLPLITPAIIGKKLRNAIVSTVERSRVAIQTSQSHANVGNHSFFVARGTEGTRKSERSNALDEEKSVDVKDEIRSKKRRIFREHSENEFDRPIPIITFAKIITLVNILRVCSRKTRV